MPFKEFTQKGGRARFGFPAVTLLRSGGFNLNRLAYEDIGSPEAVVLAFDEDETRIGVRAAKANEAHAYPVRRVSDDSFWIGAQGFVKFYDISNSSTVRYKAAMDGEYLAVDLRAEPVQREKRRESTGQD